MPDGKYDSDWMLDTIDRVLILDDPKANELWDVIEEFNNIRNGHRYMADESVEIEVPGRDLTPVEEQTFAETAANLIALLDRLEN